MKFSEKFENFITNLIAGPIEDEWYLSNFLDENVFPLKDYEAFQALEDFFDILLKYRNSDYLYETLITISSLQYRSNTTQMPKWLENNKKIFEEIKKNVNINSINNICNELIKKYRLN